MITLRQLGTFDVENYGDLLYPVVLRLILKKCEARMKVLSHSFLNGTAPQEAGFETRALRDLFDPALTSPGQIVIVGGGDILRTDWRVVADHYTQNKCDDYASPLPSPGRVESLQRLIRNSFARQAGGKFDREQFRAQWMNYPGAGPFIIDPDDLPHDSTICYLSCGVPHEFALAEREQVSRAFEKAHFIYLRDDQSREKLKRAGVVRDVRVAPDLIVTLSDYFDHATVARRGRNLLSQRGMDAERPMLCFQSQPSTQSSEAEIIRQLQYYRQRTGAQIVLLPLGYCHRDHVFLSRLAKKSGGDFNYVGAYSIHDIISVIAACDAFVGTSLHGNITAFSFGIPHLFAPLRADKSEGFMCEVNLPSELNLRAWSELNDKLDVISELDENFFAKRAAQAKLRVYEVVEELLRSLPGNARQTT